MNTVNKKFNSGLYLANDSKAKQKAKEYFLSIGVVAKDNPDKYGPDLILESGEFVEVEIKHTWKDSFIYDTLQIPVRKEKFARLGTTFIVFNSDTSKAFIINSKDILNSVRKEVSNKYITKGEMFFQVPIDKLKLINLHETST